MPCSWTSPKMFSAGPNFLGQSKNLIAFSASSKTFVPAQKPNLLNANHLLVWHKIFWTGTKCIWFFGLAQNILWPVKGQGIRANCPYCEKSHKECIERKTSQNIAKNINVPEYLECSAKK